MVARTRVAARREAELQGGQQPGTQPEPNDPSPPQPVDEPAPEPPKRGGKPKPEPKDKPKDKPKQNTGEESDEAVEGEGAAPNKGPSTRPPKQGPQPQENAAKRPHEAVEGDEDAGDKPPVKRKLTIKVRPEPQDPGFISDLEHTNHNANNASGQALERGRQTAIVNFATKNHPDTNDNSLWQGIMPLGAGGYGAAFLYYSVDENDLVNDRILVKDTWSTDRRGWRDWTLWWGDPRTNDAKLPMEVKVMRDIVGIAKDGRCVQHRGDTIWNDLYTYRVIMNYCPLGSLHTIIPDPVLLKKKPKNNGQAYGDSMDIPEPALWKWLEDMAKACQLMDEGVDPSDKIVADVGKRTIVHRDVKPPNMFFDLPSSEKGNWPSYPIATLGDFGLAFYTHDRDPHNPFSYNYWEGTPSWKPVELETFVHPDTKQPRNVGLLGSPTNVWGIGASMIRVMNRESHPHGPFYLQADDIMPTFNDNANAVYSSQLRKVLLRCVEFRPDRRITPAELLKQIAAATPGDESESDLSRGMRTREPTEDEAHLKWPIWVREHYKIGFAADVCEAQVRDEIAARDEAEEQRKKVKEAAAAAENKRPKRKGKGKK